MSTKNDNYETLIYDENGQSVEALIRKEDGSAWLTRKETANLFSISLRTLSRCFSNVDSVGDKTISVGDKNASVGDKNASVGKGFLLTAADGKNDKTKLFDLTTVMAIGFRRKTGIVTKLSSWIHDSARKNRQKTASSLSMIMVR